jgi:thiol-disulfide isomerase/thioredoxin
MLKEQAGPGDGLSGPSLAWVTLPGRIFAMGWVSRCFRASILLIVPACWFVLIVESGAAQPAAGQGAIELKDVKYSGLVEAVKAQRGKVVVVDVWATTCPPCVRNYPHLLTLQEEYRSQGLVCISVSVDLAKLKPAALEFLKKKNSAITNFWLDEPPAVWGKAWDVNGPPVMFVFDRAGRRAGKWGTEDNPVNLEEIDKMVKELLQAKP